MRKFLALLVAAVLMFGGVYSSSAQTQSNVKLDYGLIFLGDIDRNGAEDIGDVIYLKNAIMNDVFPGGTDRFDVNRDGKADIKDIIALKTVIMTRRMEIRWKADDGSYKLVNKSFPFTGNAQLAVFVNGKLYDQPVKWYTGNPRAYTVDANGYVSKVDDNGSYAGSEPRDTLVYAELPNYNRLCARLINVENKAAPDADAPERLVSFDLFSPKGEELYFNHRFIAEGSTYSLNFEAEFCVSGGDGDYSYITTRNSSDISVEWSSNKPDIATVDKNGVVTPHRTGPVTITVTIKDEYKGTAFSDNTYYNYIDIDVVPAGSKLADTSIENPNN